MSVAAATWKSWNISQVNIKILLKNTFSSIPSTRMQHAWHPEENYKVSHNSKKKVEYEDTMHISDPD